MIRKKFIALLLSTSMLTQVGCGTLLYPERQGQAPGKVDPNVLILNSIGILFFIVPGLVAFAVDFSNGAIYLPNSGSSFKLTDNGDSNQRITVEQINTLIENELNIVNVLDLPELEISRVM